MSNSLWKWRRTPSNEATVAEKGFTIVEVLIAAVVLAIGIVAMVGMQLAYLRAAEDANDITTATALGEMVVEQTRAEAIEWNTFAPVTPTFPADTHLNAMVNATPNWERLFGGEPINAQGVPYEGFGGIAVSDSSSAGFKAKFCVEGRVEETDEQVLTGSIRVSWPRARTSWNAADGCPGALTSLIHPGLGAPTWDAIYMPFAIRRYTL